MAQLLQRGATYDDLCAVTEEFIAEIIDGDLYASRHLRPSHSHGAKHILAKLDAAFDNDWWIFWAVEVHVGGDVLVPNIVAFRRRRFPIFPDVPYFTEAPDWIVEVIDRGTVRLDRFLKMPKYAAAGVEHAWLLDPNNRALEVYRRAGNRFELQQMFDETDDIVRAEPFDAIEFPLSSLWLPTAPDPRN